MARLLCAAFALALLAVGIAASPFSVGTDPNRFIVTFGLVPDPFHYYNYFTMPRTVKEAMQDHFSSVRTSNDSTSIWCRKNDYRVCVIFDALGTVAGIQVSVAVKEIEAIPHAKNNLPEWTRQTFLGEDVFSATTYFVSKGLLENGGRTISEKDHTAPNGIYILQTDSEGKETSRLHVPIEESGATGAGFTTQNCFYGMGKHYFQELSEKTVCESHRPYFMLYNPKSKNLQGFGLGMYGKPSQGRGWFEAPSASVAKSIAPNSPECMTKWIDNYGLFTFHIYFVARPWFIFC
ncbi:uncharacterized protein LOC117642712 [Thrips palmi]|uniref:Uncharacterized protein LOC117642712 n=1 Tax=Thrips palmi TaxID=161013 RepID=A0A6P8YJ37_THRPL|nr:uncharacterized protein LOC117642712 [Thrips palmi]